MSTDLSSGRTNQKLRTYYALLSAVRDVLDAGRYPTLEDVADVAMVSRATVYRYFASVEALVAEATIEAAVPDPDTVMGHRTELLDRVLVAVAASTTGLLDNEVATHAMSKSMAQRRLEAPEEDTATRPARRLTLLDAALAPHRARLGPEVTERLRSALALVCGLEAVISAREVVGLDPEAAAATFAWAATKLVAAAEDEAAAR